MKKITYILGLNTTYHELSACLIKNGQLVAAIEEERFSRIKRGKKALVNNPDIIPFAAINYCLKQENISLRDVDYIGLSFCPEKRLKNVNIDPYYLENDWGSKEGEELFYAKLMQIPEILSSYAGTDLKGKVKWIEHHICHAGSAYYVSPFNESAVLSIDGIGETTSTWLGFGKDNKMEKLKSIEYPNSIGFLWEKFSTYLGFSEYDAAKVMGLASYGNGEKFYSQFQQLVSIEQDGEFTVDNDKVKFRLTNDYTDLEQLFGIKKLNDLRELNQDHSDIAAGLQKITDNVVLNLAEYLSKATKSENICMAGGVALNCVSNYELLKSGIFKKIYIQPAANDAGTALGAAYYIWNDVLNGKKEFVMDHAYWGVEYTDKEIEEVLKKEKVHYEKLTNIEAKTAQLLSEGNIIGWFQGRIEWGPRALGNRSLLADPRKADMKEILNIRIKKREPFRPFAPSVLKEESKKWFTIPNSCSSISTDFMEFTFPVKEDKKTIVPAITHVDGTSRIQTVDERTNPKYYKLISEFQKITKVPMVLNTSFNDNEPIVCSPLDAVKTFKKTRMDYLVLSNYLVSKLTAKEE